MSTPMPKSFDPFKKEAKVEQEPPSRRSTVQGVPTELAQDSKAEAGRRADILEALETPFEEPPEPTPFEEPKIDEFGTGVGV